MAALPNDIGPVEAVAQPKDIEHFDAATFTWVGGNNQVDNPQVVVERMNPSGTWEDFGGQNGAVQTMVHYPGGLPGLVQTYVGRQDWTWSANFEAYAAFPKRLGGVPPGTYRFVVDGNIRQGFKTVPYHLESGSFTVSPWSGIQVENVTVSGTAVSFEVPPIIYPASYTSEFPFIDGTDGGKRICKQCSFRPWATVGRVASATVEVVRANGSRETVAAKPSGSTWSAPASLADGDRVTIRVIDSNGETSRPLTFP
jgi:hypothetical protein